MGPAIAAVAEALGQPLMPWQRMVADVGGELVEDSDTGLLIPAYRSVALTVPRQSGKTTLILSWMVQRCVGWVDDWGPQRVVYSAQTGNDARKKLVEDQTPMLIGRKKVLGVARVRRGMGNEGVDFVNGSMIGLLASSEDSGHGKTVDLGVKDELFADIDDRREQSLVPAMATRRAGQMLACSTAGTDTSMALIRVVDAGRAAVEADERRGVAYFEWSADPDRDDPDDPVVWRRVMPALGHTISEDVVRHARKSMPDGEFRRAFLNVATKADDRVIAAQAWQAVCDPQTAPGAPLTFGVDTNPERSATAIVAADPSGRVELVEHRPGTGWVCEWLVERTRKWGAPVALDPSGPVGSLAGDLERMGVRLVPVTGADMQRACGQLFDAVAERAVSVRTDPRLDAAVAGARRQARGDAWVWARRDGSVDVSPLVAMTVAVWAARSTAAQPADLRIW